MCAAFPTHSSTWSMPCSGMKSCAAGTADYDITAYQPVLYRAESIEEIVDVVGGFFITCTDESIAELAARAGAVK